MISDNKLFLTINNDEFDGSSDLKEHIERCIDEVSEIGKPKVLHIDVIKSDSMRADKRNRVISLDIPINPIEGLADENLNPEEKKRLSNIAGSKAQRIYDFVVNELAIKYIETKPDKGLENSVSDFIKNLDAMKSFNLDGYTIVEDKLSGILNSQGLSESMIEKSKPFAIESFLKENKNSLNGKTLHVVSFNGQKYLFGLRNKNEILSMHGESEQFIEILRHLGIPEKRIELIQKSDKERALMFKATEPNGEAMLDIAKGMLVMEYKDNLPAELSKLLQTTVQRMPGEE